MSVSVRVEGLSITRGERRLFADVNLAVRSGEWLELRGANGSGKTSLLRAIAGFMRPKAGRIDVAGVEEPTLALHYLGHLNGLKATASPRDHIRYWAGLFGARAEGADPLEAVGLMRQADLPARVLSQGQARRLALARLLVAPRPLWLLDEPAAALDAQGRAMLCGLIERHCAQGGAAIAALHEPLGLAPSHTLTLGEA
jgi:heme exporter protein A